MSCSRTQHSDAGEARTRGLSVSSQALLTIAYCRLHPIGNHCAAVKRRRDWRYEQAATDGQADGRDQVERLNLGACSPQKSFFFFKLKLFKCSKIALSLVTLLYNCGNRGSYMSAHVLLNLLNELGKRDKMRGLPSILSLFRNEFNKFNNTRARMLDSIYHMTLR